MFDIFSNPTEMYPPSAQEFAQRVREAEKRQALVAAESTTDAGAPKTRKMGLIDAITTLFGGPTLF